MDYLPLVYVSAGATLALACIIIGTRIGRGLSPLASPFPMKVKTDKPKPVEPPKPQEKI